MTKGIQARPLHMLGYGDEGEADDVAAPSTESGNASEEPARKTKRSRIARGPLPPTTDGGPEDPT
jgi:hypothetical protein